MREFLAELWRRSPVPTAGAGLHVALALVALALMPFDQRTVLGVDPWLKPFKFALSIALYLGTLGWLLGHLTGYRRTRVVIGGGATACLLLESVLLWTQAARGVRSHFNFDSAFDGSVYGAMGILILVSTVLELLLLVLFLLPRPSLPRTYLLGVRLGLVVFLIGSAVGGALVANEAHAVGVPDGGPGLPLLNWSTEGGDLRVAHALGLHGLQLFPLAGWWLSRRTSDARGTAALAAFLLGYLSLLAATYLQATAGRPLL